MAEKMAEKKRKSRQYTGESTGKNLGELMGYKRSSYSAPPPPGSPETDREFMERIRLYEGTRSRAENAQVEMQSELVERMRRQDAFKARLDAAYADEEARTRWAIHRKGPWR